MYFTALERKRMRKAATALAGAAELIRSYGHLIKSEHGNLDLHVDDYAERLYGLTEEKD